jgi:hypothetical protein
VVVARWENALDMARMRRHLDRETEGEADDPEKLLVTEELVREQAHDLEPRPAAARL